MFNYNYYNGIGSGGNINRYGMQSFDVCHIPIIPTRVSSADMLDRLSIRQSVREMFNKHDFGTQEASIMSRCERIQESLRNETPGYRITKSQIDIEFEKLIAGVDTSTSVPSSYTHVGTTVVDFDSLEREIEEIQKVNVEFTPTQTFEEVRQEAEKKYKEEVILEGELVEEEELKEETKVEVKEENKVDAEFEAFLEAVEEEVVKEEAKEEVVVSPTLIETAEEEVKEPETVFNSTVVSQDTEQNHIGVYVNADVTTCQVANLSVDGPMILPNEEKEEVEEPKHLSIYSFIRPERYRRLEFFFVDYQPEPVVRIKEGLNAAEKQLATKEIIRASNHIQSRKERLIEEGLLIVLDGKWEVAKGVTVKPIVKKTEPVKPIESKVDRVIPSYVKRQDLIIDFDHDKELVDLVKKDDVHGMVNYLDTNICKYTKNTATLHKDGVLAYKENSFRFKAGVSKEDMINQIPVVDTNKKYTLQTNDTHTVTVECFHNMDSAERLHMVDNTGMILPVKYVDSSVVYTEDIGFTSDSFITGAMRNVLTFDGKTTVPRGVFIKRTYKLSKIGKLADYQDRMRFLDMLNDLGKPNVGDDDVNPYKDFNIRVIQRLKERLEEIKVFFTAGIQHNQENNPDLSLVYFAEGMKVSLLYHIPAIVLHSDRDKQVLSTVTGVEDISFGYNTTLFLTYRDKYKQKLKPNNSSLELVLVDNSGTYCKKENYYLNPGVYLINKMELDDIETMPRLPVTPIKDESKEDGLYINSLEPHGYRRGQVYFNREEVNDRKLILTANEFNKIKENKEMFKDTEKEYIIMAVKEAYTGLKEEKELLESTIKELHAEAKRQKHKFDMLKETVELKFKKSELSHSEREFTLKMANEKLKVEQAFDSIISEYEDKKADLEYKAEIRRLELQELREKNEFNREMMYGDLIRSNLKTMETFTAATAPKKESQTKGALDLLGSILGVGEKARTFL